VGDFKIDMRRIRAAIIADDEKHIHDYWVRCLLCFGYTVFNSSEDRYANLKRGACSYCGHGFDFRKSATGIVPRGRALIWDEREETQLSPLK
jgi:hypothetical protein